LTASEHEMKCLNRVQIFLVYINSQMFRNPRRSDVRNFLRLTPNTPCLFGSSKGVNHTADAQRRYAKSRLSFARAGGARKKGPSVKNCPGYVH